MLFLHRLMTETLLGNGCKSLVQSHRTAGTVLLASILCLPTCQYNCHKIMVVVVVKGTEEYLVGDDRDSRCIYRPNKRDDGLL